MAAIFFGSIGTIADTSELQRQAFNQAFKAHGLDWYWHRDEYLTMLKESGGQNRIADYAHSVGQTVDVETIHQLKSSFFQSSLSQSQVKPRLGVVETIQNANNKGLKLAFVTTTTQKNVLALLDALYPTIQSTDFDLIVNADRVARPKPDKAAYTFALEKLGERSADCIAIEDNLDGVRAARSAGLNCIAFPNENTVHHNFEEANYLVDRLDCDALRNFMTRHLSQSMKQAV